MTSKDLLSSQTHSSHEILASISPNKTAPIETPTKANDTMDFMTFATSTTQEKVGSLWHRVFLDTRQEPFKANSHRHRLLTLSVRT